MDKTRILLVDDEATFTQLLKMNLEATDRYEVRVEQQGAAAVPAARLFHPDVIFLDVVMPDVGGDEVAAELSSDPGLKHTPVVFLTAIVSREEASASGGQIGGHAFLAKPVGVDDVVACVEDIQSRRGKEA